jgi:dCTP deaminase
MFLSANEITAEVRDGRVRIDPFNPDFLKPASYVLRLGNSWRAWAQADQPIEVWSELAGQSQLSELFHSDECVLRIGDLVLASTMERVGIPNGFMGLLINLSHLARFGISVHFQAGLVSPGFGATAPTALTLELASFNPAPLKLRAGMPICHLALARLSECTTAENLLARSIYEGRDVPCPPMLYEEFSSATNMDSPANPRCKEE